MCVYVSLTEAEIGRMSAFAEPVCVWKCVTASDVLV